MMPETAQAADEPPACGELRRKADGLLDRYDGVMADVAAGRMPPDQGRRISLLTAALREVRTQLGRIAFQEAVLEEAEVRAEARGFERGRAARTAGRHRSASQRPGTVTALRPFQTGSLAVAFAAAARSGGRNVVKHARVILTHKASVGLAATSLAAAGAATVVAVSFNTNLTPYTTHMPVQQPPAAAQAQVSPTWQYQPRLRVETHGSASPSAIPVFAGGGASPSASPLPSSSASDAVAPGTLDVTESTITLRPADPGELSGQFTITAAGGPVTWTASAPGLDLDAYGGTIPAGHLQVITVTMTTAGGEQPPGSAVITVYAGGQPSPGTSQQVQVRWGGTGRA
jgi:hypothetical protein